MHLGVAATAALALVASAAGASDPVPLSGEPLGETGVRLVAAAKAPSIVDLDSGLSSAIPGIPYARRGFVHAVAIGGRSGVVIAGGRLYGVRAGSTASRLGLGTEAAPDPDGGSVWVKRRVRRAHCTLRRVRLDGHQLRAPRAIPCAWTIYPGGSLGLGVRAGRVIDPVTGRTVFKTRGHIVAVAGKTVVLQPPSSDQLTLVDAVSRARRQASDPVTDGRLYQIAVDVGGRFLAMAFGNPSWTSEGRYLDDQYFDAWVLDTETGKVVRLPGMPAFIALKFADMAWMADGRLVLLARSNGNYVVALWKPAQERLKVKTVHLPALASGSGVSFAPLG